MGLTPAQRKKNEAYIKSLPCLVTGRYGADCAHFPVRRSQGGDSNLLNIIPLSRDWHRKIDDYEEPWREIVTELARLFHTRILDADTFSVIALGKPWWKEEDGD